MRTTQNETVVYIDRLYDDPWPGPPPPWPRSDRVGVADYEWLASTGGTGPSKTEEAFFDKVEDAIAWGRERAEVVLVRLGADVEAMYSAGARAATDHMDGSGWPFPPWPPATWPDYPGPPEPGWPSFRKW